MSWWAIALAWSGWAVAVAAAWSLRRRLAVVGDAEHELRGAATAIGLAADRIGAGAEFGLVVRLEVDRMGAALADLAAARGAAPAPPTDLEAGRLAQVLGNVIANAAEHGVGPVEVSGARVAGGLARLEVRNRERPRRSGPGAGRGHGIVIAKRAARELGGGVSVESEGGFTRTVVELPTVESPAVGLPTVELPTVELPTVEPPAVEPAKVADASPEGARTAPPEAPQAAPPEAPQAAPPDPSRDDRRRAA